METESAQLPVKEKKKKKVSWPDEDSLVSIQYFEVDESERG